MISHIEFKKKKTKTDKDTVIQAKSLKEKWLLRRNVLKNTNQTNKVILILTTITLKTNITTKNKRIKKNQEKTSYTHIFN